MCLYCVFQAEDGIRYANYGLEFRRLLSRSFEIIAANRLDVDCRSLKMRVQGYAVYTDPPLGRSGMTEAGAITEGHEILVSRRPMSLVSRAVEKGERSEEHTSELQSLMRISYAVFCLKKKKPKHTQQ